MRTIKEFFKQTLPSPVWDGVVYAHRVSSHAQHAAVLYLSRKHWQSVPRLRALQDKHRGERCFIIGNGPSLNRMDLSLLRSEFTFGMNRIYLLFPKLGFSTTYYVCVNSLVIEQCAQEIERLPMPKFLSWRSRNLIRFTPSTIFLNTDGRLAFARDITGHVWEGATVTYVAMQIAFYLGFSEVVLIGVDHNFSTHGPPGLTIESAGDDPNHFAPNYFGKGFRWQLPNLEGSEKAYKLAKQAFEEDNRRIVDATVGGNLQVFPKVRYEDMLNKS